MIFINHTEDLNGKVAVVDIKGPLDSSTSTEFEEFMNQLLEKRNIYIVLNASGLDYISSTGIGAMLYIQKKILALNGIFVVSSLSEEISALYGLLGFDKIIKIASTKEEAVSIIDKQLKLISDVKKEPVKPEPEHDKTEDVPVSDSKTPAKELNDIADESVSETTFENPIILECTECKNMIRVKKSGNYICPNCKTEFLVDTDQTVIF